ncbi:MAG: pyridoxamine 5'-phosphate oxidase family protein [Clostridia bacterium]|nr:pyridoxamine 5'-phosphate oxidase family protein [Clostridia bacterium]
MRRSDRQVTALDEIAQIVDKAKVLHLGLMDGDWPYVVPLHYGYEFLGEELVLYVHSALEGHKLDLLRENPHGFVELSTEAELISGGENPCKYGAAYASVMGRGQVELVTDPEEKVKGLSLLMVHQTGRQFPITAAMVQSVAVIRIVLQSYTAKARPKK